MTEMEVIELFRLGLWIALRVALPVLAVALAAGLAIGLFQALTSVQEMTLTFVPKLALVVLAFWLSIGYSGRLLIEFFQQSLLPRVAGS